IVGLAEQAQHSRDTGFAIRAQAQGALLVWPYDRQKARAINQRAFRRLLRAGAGLEPASALEAAARQQLRVEFLSELASYDPELADQLTRAYVLSKGSLTSPRANNSGWPRDSQWAAAQNAPQAEGRELLVTIALQMAGADKIRAAALGQLSLEA